MSAYLSFPALLPYPVASISSEDVRTSDGSDLGVPDNPIYSQNVKDLLLFNEEVCKSFLSVIFFPVPVTVNRLGWRRSESEGRHRRRADRLRGRCKCFRARYDAVICIDYAETVPFESPKYLPTRVSVLWISYIRLANNRQVKVVQFLVRAGFICFVCCASTLRYHECVYAWEPVCYEGPL